MDCRHLLRSSFWKDGWHNCLFWVSISKISLAQETSSCDKRKNWIVPELGGIILWREKSFLSFWQLRSVRLWVWRPWQALLPKVVEHLAAIQARLLPVLLFLLQRALLLQGQLQVSSAGVNLYTSVIYYYINAASQQLATSAAGSGSATATNSYRSGSYATSSHRVTSVSDRWGSWSCGLSAYR